MSLQEIVEKGWYFFIPFLPIRFAKKLWRKDRNKSLEDKKSAEAVVLNDVEKADTISIKVITEELIPMIKECRKILNQKQEMDETYTVTERLWEGLLEACIYLFGDNKEFIKELDKMETKFYFRDEKLAILRLENDRIKAEKEKIQDEKDKIQNEKDRIQEEKDEIQKKNTELEKIVEEQANKIEEFNNSGYMRFVRLVRKWKNYMFL